MTKLVETLAAVFSWLTSSWTWCQQVRAVFCTTVLQQCCDDVETSKFENLAALLNFLWLLQRFMLPHDASVKLMLASLHSAV
jgi:hypothetical protein